jgi:biopolymer transport protein ExbB
MKVFDLSGMLLQGWPVLSILFFMSILSFTIIVDRFAALRRGRVDAGQFIKRVCRILLHDSPAAAANFCRDSRFPLAAVAQAVISQAGNREDKERAMRYAIQMQIRNLESLVPVLGTIASTAPFVGLLGTVIGIIRAFASIAQNVGGGPEVVAVGIAEALVTTAGGLVVAIPALIGFNYFVRGIQRQAEEMDLACYELIETLCSRERERL